VPVGSRSLHFVGVAVGVDTDNGVDKFCQHGHRPSPSCMGAGQPSAPAWVEVTERHIRDGSRPRADRLLIRPTGGPGWCRQPRRTGQMKGTPKRPNPYRVTSSHRRRAW
jgi:hypothetical protein